MVRLFIFRAIKNIVAAVLTTDVNVHVLESIALIRVLRRNQVSVTELIGSIIVMGAMGRRIKRKAEEAPLIK